MPRKREGRRGVQNRGRKRVRETTWSGIVVRFGQRERERERERKRESRRVVEANRGRETKGGG